MSLLCLLSFSTSVYGASVTVVPRASQTNPGVQFKNQFGYVNVTLTETFNSIPGIYANGTMFFDVSGTTAPTQGTYSFQVKSYGNGTLVLRFAGPQPFQVTQTAASSNYITNRQEITYTASQTSGLALLYSGAPLANASLIAGLVTLFSLMTIIPPVGIMVWILRARPEGDDFVSFALNLFRDYQPFIMVLLIVMFIGVVGLWTTVILGVV